MGHNFTDWSDSVEEGDTICSFQGSVYKSPEKSRRIDRSSRRIKNHESPNLSPIKKQHDRSKSLTRHSERLISPYLEANDYLKDMTFTNLDHAYGDFRHKMERLEKSASTESEDNFAGHNLYNQAREVQELLAAKKEKRPPSCAYSTFHYPEQSWMPSYIERPSDIIEDPRHQSMSVDQSPIQLRKGRKNDDIIENLVDLSIKTMKDIGTGPSREAKYKRPKSVLKPSNPPVIPRKFRHDYAHKMEESKHYAVKATNTTLPTKATNTSLPFRVSPERRRSPSPQARSESTSYCFERAPRPNVKQIVRSCFNQAFNDVDSIPRKGAQDAYRREMESSIIYTALNARRAHSQPRQSVNSRSTSINRLSPPKEPFCSASNGDSAQAIHGNEAELKRLVENYYPHWRTFVRQLLADRSVEKDVAVRFLIEIENRRLSKYDYSDPIIGEFNAKDEKIARRLGDLLGRGQFSRLRQLKILYQVLREFI